MAVYLPPNKARIVRQIKTELYASLSTTVLLYQKVSKKNKDIREERDLGS